MSLECGECEHDLRGGHADDCSRAQKCLICRGVVSRLLVSDPERRRGMARRCQCGQTVQWEDE
jgi:hypothetical protein